LPQSESAGAAAVDDVILCGTAVVIVPTPHDHPRLVGTDAVVFTEEHTAADLRQSAVALSPGLSHPSLSPSAKLRLLIVTSGEGGAMRLRSGTLFLLHLPMTGAAQLPLVCESDRCYLNRRCRGGLMVGWQASALSTEDGGIGSLVSAHPVLVPSPIHAVAFFAIIATRIDRCLVAQRRGQCWSRARGVIGDAGVAA
jgi:hypothetical protein